jgi:hypothetical protein
VTKSQLMQLEEILAYYDIDETAEERIKTLIQTITEDAMQDGYDRGYDDCLENQPD